MQSVPGVLELPLSKTSPAFLHANSTSHTWIFSAIAELVDNAYDPDVKAKVLDINVSEIGQEKVLTFLDNGNGMDANTLHKMLSFGFCDKNADGEHQPIGKYGNGFKSGSMRLGDDAIVFTMQNDSMSVGLLSQTFLREIGAEMVLVPIVSYKTGTDIRIPVLEDKHSLEMITAHSLFKSEQELLFELERIRGQLLLRNSSTGTKIYIYNLKRHAQRFELDFMSDPDDILNPLSEEIDKRPNSASIIENVAKHRTSLREYLSVLYLKPRMRIVLRSKPVQTKYMTKSLSRTEKDVYKPMWLKEKSKGFVMTFGFNSQSIDDYGVMIYNKNRLIKAYEHVGCQKSNSGTEKKGFGVVGVVDLDFLEPIHNKQDFNKTDRYNSALSAVGMKLTEYWHMKKKSPTPTGLVEHTPEESVLHPDWTWVQCDLCLKWRRLIDNLTKQNLPEKWFCRFNSDKSHNRCDHEEEQEDEDEMLITKRKATYDKTPVKKRRRKEKQQKCSNKEQNQRLPRLLNSKHRDASSVQRGTVLSNNSEEVKTDASDHERNTEELLKQDIEEVKTDSAEVDDERAGQTLLNQDDVFIISDDEGNDVKPGHTNLENTRLATKLQDVESQLRELRENVREYIHLLLPKTRIHHLENVGVVLKKMIELHKDNSYE